MFRFLQKERNFMNYYYNTVDVNILVNGHSVAYYYKDGKTYIEAKDGSEYEIQIKNKDFNRILAVASVDGLSVLTGLPASTEDGGYVINPHDSFKIKGFRYSDEKVGAFKFVNKNNSYASEQLSSENCGVIGVVIFNDASTYTQTVTKPFIYKSFLPPSLSSEPFYCSLTKDMSHSNNLTDNMQVNCQFDMGSGWGSSKESKVTSTKFERGYIIHSFDFYYASRNALIDMGVIENSVPKIAFPKSFKHYATPPKNWKC